MTITPTHIRDVFIIVPEPVKDERGFLMESYRKDKLAEAGINDTFPQENHSLTLKKNTVRGLHFQWNPPMSKLMRVTRGSAMLIAVDIRKGSPTMGNFITLLANAENKNQLYAPAGFARGLLSLEDNTEVIYKCGGVYDKNSTASIRYDSVGYDWPLEGQPIISEYDANAMALKEWFGSPQSEVFRYDA